MNQVQLNSGVHQLPSDCYPPTDSDDESFVVLERCLPPESIQIVSQQPLELLSDEVIDQSLELASEAVNNMMKSSLPTAPAMPQITTNVGNYFNSVASLSTECSQDEIQQKIESLIQENYNLKETLHQNNMVMKNQYETLAKWQQDVEKVHESHKQKFKDTKEYIQKLELENRILKCPLSDDKDKDLAAKMEQLRLENDATAKQSGLLANQYQEDIKKLKEDFKQQEVDFDKKEQNYLEQITNLKITVDKLKSAQINPEEIDKLKKQLMSAQVYITELKQSKKEVESEVEAKQIKINELQEVVKDLMSDKDRAVALEKQLELYKDDFNVERTSKTNLITEKNKLADDLHNIQRRNEELLEELETLRSKCSFVEVSSPVRQSGNAASAPPQAAAPPSPPPASYACPLCMEKFRTYRTLEEHVDTCLNNTM